MSPPFDEVRDAVFGRQPRAVLVGAAATAVFSFLGIAVHDIAGVPLARVLLGGLVGSTVASSMAVSNWGDGIAVGVRAVTLGFVGFRLLSAALFFVGKTLSTGDYFVYWTAFNGLLYGVLFYPMFFLLGIVGGVLGARIRLSRVGNDVRTA